MERIDGDNVGIAESSSDNSSESDSSAESIIGAPQRRHRNASRIEESSSSGSESDWISPRYAKKPALADLDESSSSSAESNGQSEKCPICLVKFRAQEVGSPDACDHVFCCECILEWSKNVTTCPIDRQLFRHIVVRNHLDGCVVRQIQVEAQPTRFDGDAPNADDLTFCEVCGASDREDRMLLCDCCDQGYHLECLVPPLPAVPMGVWMCAQCDPENRHQDFAISFGEVELLIRDAAEIGAPMNVRRVARSSNIVPRTRQSDRIRARIISNRREEPPTMIQVTVDQPSTSQRRMSVQKTKKKKKRRRKTGKSRIRITYEIDDKTGQKIVIKSKAKRTKRRTKRRIVAKKTTKHRLAKHFGICAPTQEGQLLPDVRIASGSDGNLTYLRSRAGIPALHLFGNRDELEYFSGSDVEDVGGSTHLRRRRPTASDAAVFRRAAARKAHLLPSVPYETAASSCNVLDSIIASQEKMHTKNAVLSLRTDGSLQIDSNRIDVNQRQNLRMRTTPLYAPTEERSAREGHVGHHSQAGESRRAGISAATSISNNSVTTSSCDTHRTGNDNSGVETVSTSKPDNSVETDGEEDKAEEEDVSSTTNLLLHPDDDDDDEDSHHSEDDDDECPNFNIYSKDTLNLVANRNVENEGDEVGSSVDVNNRTPVRDEIDDDIPSPPRDMPDDSPVAQTVHNKVHNPSRRQDLYSDSDEDVVRASNDATRPFGIGDIRSLTEDISEEERSYTPCLDERTLPSLLMLPLLGAHGEGLAGLDTEAISDDERNDFDESHHAKPVSDPGDALEINAKESELDFSTTTTSAMRPEDYEEGEIVDRLKKLAESSGETLAVVLAQPAVAVAAEATAVEAPVTSFKRISKSTKERNYRDKDHRERSRSRSREKNKENERERKRKKEKRKELERYNVRSLVADKPRKTPKDKFGRDATRKRSMSRSTRSPSFSPAPQPPPQPLPQPSYRSPSRDRLKRRAAKSRRSSSRSTSRKRSRLRSRKMRSMERASGGKSKKKTRSISNHRSRTPSPSSHRHRHRDWGGEVQQMQRRAWTPSPSRSRSPRERHVSPSWTPPRLVDSSTSRVQPRNLTVILTNDSSKKKKERKSERKKKDAGGESKSKKRRRERTPLPSKEVFASGDNILVSVSFNKDGEEATKRTKALRVTEEDGARRSRKDKEKRREVVVVTPPPPPMVAQSAAKARKKRQQDMAAVKPVAIIDLDRSPFKEMTPSPKDVIVLSDSDHSPEKTVVGGDGGSSQQQPLMGPKTPPEPQVKFSLTSAKLQQIRQTNNPLHDPDEEVEEEEAEEIDPQDELEQRLNEAMHKGPNTPASEPPNSPPSSPDAYDPFDPTKSRSPSPMEDVTPVVVAPSISVIDEERPLASLPMEEEDDSVAAQSEALHTSHTPPPPATTADIQPADSQSNATTNTPEDSNTNTSSEKSSVAMPSMNPVGSSPIFLQGSKPPVNAAVSMAVTSTPSSLATMTTMSSAAATSRINIINSTIIPTASAPAQPLMKASPTKAAMKMMPAKRPLASASKGGKTDDASNMEMDSPYSPGPSDFDDLFEPPAEHKKPSAAAITTKSTPTKAKSQSSFDALFGASPPMTSKRKSSEKNAGASLTKRAVAAMAGGINLHSKCKQVKVDEDSLRILDELPNSAVEMQVKDKFLKKLNRQERVVEEVKLVLKPHYNKKHINKDEYKDILRRAVPKICHNKSGEINPQKIQNLIEAYVKKFRHNKKVSSSSSSVNLQK